MAALKDIIARITGRRKSARRLHGSLSNPDMEAHFQQLSGCFDDEYLVRHLYDIAGFYNQKPPPQD
ncbi:MAG: hypothetical protein EXR67_00085 [Dehalococcoidia bacterium]|nr:hypothetical protein [Dehalococcoidia bacterium]